MARKRLSGAIVGGILVHVVLIVIAFVFGVVEGNIFYSSHRLWSGCAAVFILLFFYFSTWGLLPLLVTAMGAAIGAGVDNALAKFPAAEEAPAHVRHSGQQRTRPGDVGGRGVCPACAARLRFTDGFSRDKVRCPRCDHRLHVTTAIRPSRTAVLSSGIVRRQLQAPQRDDGERTETGEKWGRELFYAMITVVMTFPFLLALLGVITWNRPRGDGILTLTCYGFVSLWAGSAVGLVGLSVVGGRDLDGAERLLGGALGGACVVALGILSLARWS